MKTSIGNSTDQYDEDIQTFSAAITTDATLSLSKFWSPEMICERKQHSKWKGENYGACLYLKRNWIEHKEETTSLSNFSR